MPFATPQAAAPSIVLSLATHFLTVTYSNLPAGTNLWLFAGHNPPGTDYGAQRPVGASPWIMDLEDDDQEYYTASNKDDDDNLIPPTGNVVHWLD